MKFKISKTDQSKAILARGNVGADRWSEKHIGIPAAKTHEVSYADVFNVTEDDVYEYVMQIGWDERVVAQVKGPLPSGDDFNTPAPFYALLPKRDGLFPLGVDSMTWPERPRWTIYNFPSDRERVLHVIDDLFFHQSAFWGGPRRIQYLKEWDSNEDGSWTLRRR